MRLLYILQKFLVSKMVLLLQAYIWVQFDYKDLFLLQYPIVEMMTQHILFLLIWWDFGLLGCS